MQPLIKIETVPISIEYVEKPQRHASIETAKLHLSKDSNNISIKSNPIRIPAMDNFESGSTDSGNSYTAVAGFMDQGFLKLNVAMIKSGGSDAFQRVGRGIENIIDILPKDSPPEQAYKRLQISFNMKSINSELQNRGEGSLENFDTSFMPPDLEMKVVQQPKVIIKYVGGPIYIPKSSDPDYVPPKETNQIFDGKPSFESKA